MSKDRKKLLHIHSSVNDKQPTPATLELGELGVNNAKGNAFISTKNSNGEVVRFSEDETIIGWMEQKEVFPYEGYMRGADNSQVDGVTEQDLLDNKSNLIIKLNQVVPENTDYSPYDEKVNGAKDIYGNLINPISSGGYKDGAGLAIDMSNYAMIGANPSFSSVTTTCGAELQGKTSVKGSTCGSELDVNVNTIKENATTIDTTACTRNYNNTNDFKVVECTEGQGEALIQTCHKFEVNSNNIVLEQCGNSGKTSIKSCDEVKLESKNIILTDGDCGNGQTTIETNDLCLVGEQKVNVYGDVTNLGLDCDDSKIASKNRVFGDGVLITNDISEVSTYPSSKDVVVKSYGNICEEATSAATLFGAVSTKVGVSCDNASSSTTTTIEGGRTVVDAYNENLGLTAKQNIVESAEGNIIITANNNICEQAGNEAHFYGANVTHIGKGCDGSKSESAIIYERIPKTDSCAIKSSTVDGALDEVLERDRVYHSETTGSDGAIVHTVWQDSGSCKNSFTFEIRNTKVKMSADTYPAESEYLKKYVLWQEFGNTVESIGTIDIPKDHILKDARIVNGHVSGGTFTPCVAGDDTCEWFIELIWNVFNQETGHADDKVVYLPANSLVQDYEFNNTPAIKFNTYYDGQKTQVSADTTIKVHSSENGDKYATKENGTHTISGYTLTIKQGGETVIFDPFDEDTEITMNHSALTIDYGVDVTDKTDDSYDTSEAKTVCIPTSVGHLNRGKFTVKHCNDEVTFDPSTDTSITMSHGTLKLTHNGLEDAEFDPCTSTSYTMPHSALTINYGKQGAVSSSVTYDTSAQAEIYIPNGQVTIEHCNDEITFDPSTTTGFTLSHGTLSLTYGNPCGENDLDWSACSNEEFIIPQTISDITNGRIVIEDTCDDDDKCILVPDSDICVNGNIKADAFYATSDERLKENIQSISFTDYEKAGIVDLKSFNFKDDETKTKTYGVIAQSLKAVGLDNIVHNDDKGNLNVDYTSFLILRIASLESQLKSMEEKINDLMHREK